MQIHGRSIIAGRVGQADAASVLFHALDPSTGRQLPTEFAAASPADVDQACVEAWNAFHAMQTTPAAARSDLLDDIADRIASLAGALTDTVLSETGLTSTRVISERERTVGVFRMFAQCVREGSWSRACIEPGDAARRPNPRPDLRRMLRPLGPVAVFGASNFPLAYGAAGGDTASALAAGCPVVVKSHPLHPSTGELLASVLAECVREHSFPPGTFSFLQAGGARERTVGEELIDHPCIRAAGFTGSHVGGMALTNRGRSRPDPIPVFAEMGSINPVVLFKHALETQGPAIAIRIAQSVINACGQMCTCPGLLLALRDKHTDAFTRELSAAFNAAEPGIMLGVRLRDAFVLGIEELLRIEGVDAVAGAVPSITSSQVAAAATGVLLRTRGSVFLREPILRSEVFGPSTVLVVCEHEEELFACLSAISGSLTGTIFAGAYDAAFAARAVPVLEQRVGRIVFNSVPTGVEVNAAMIHGGPYPATSAPNSTAQGILAMERWCRPVCYQNAPDAVLPPELRDANPLGVERIVGSVRTKEAIRRGQRASVPTPG